MYPLISIAVATYNGEKYLKEQLDSIYNQTYRNIEVVVSDDKSNDKTISILEEYRKKNGLIFSVNENQLGVTKNFENAIIKCKGRYILLSDQDDIWMPEKIERLLFNIGTASLIYSDGLLFHSDNKLPEERLSDNKLIRLFGMDSTNKNFIKYTSLNSFILGCSIMFERTILKKAIPFYESDFNHDWWLVNSAQYFNGVKYLDEILFKYRVHSNNFSIKKNFLPQEFQEKKSKTFFQKILSYDIAETLQTRQSKKIKFLNLINIYKSESNRGFFLDLATYCNSKNWIIDLEGFWIVLKYRKFFFPKYSRLIRSYLVLRSIIK